MAQAREEELVEGLATWPLARLTRAPMQVVRECFAAVGANATPKTHGGPKRLA